MTSIPEDPLKAIRHRTSTFLPRLVIGTSLLTALCLPSLFQPLLSAIYQHLYNSSFYRSSMFETALTVFSYAVIELSYTYKFGHNPHLRIDVRDGTFDTYKARPRLPKMRRPYERMGEILLYITPLLIMDLVMIKKFADVPLNDMRQSGGYAPIDASFATTLASSLDLKAASPNIRRSFLMPTLHNFSLSSPVQLKRALPPSPPTSRRIVLELMVSFFIYDAVFFAAHLAFHRIGILARFHRPHHMHPEIHPQVTNRLSVVERLSLVLLANFSLNIIGSHVLTRTCFVPLFVYLLVEIHSGMDSDWGYHRLLPAEWASGPKRHAEHHRTGGGGYAPFFRWWDVLLEWCDGVIHANISH